MRLTFVQLSRFAARWAQLRLTDEDLQALEQLILHNPEAGVVISGSGGLRKVRFAPPSRHTGKSGAFRIGYAYFHVAETVFLLSVFSKNEQANLTHAEKIEARKLIEIVSQAFSRHQREK